MYVKTDFVVMSDSESEVEQEYTCTYCSNTFVGEQGEDFCASCDRPMCDKCRKYTLYVNHCYVCWKCCMDVPVPKSEISRIVKKYSR
jgi:hypothetical protein